MMIALLLLYPVFASVLLALVRSRRVNVFLVLSYAVLHLMGSVILCFRPETMYPFFAVDPLNTVFLLVLSILQFGISFYRGDFLRGSNLNDRWHRIYAVCLMTFIMAMTGVILSAHAGMMWVFLEATTLASAPFIYYENNRSALEATWKYVFICSVGIALAFVGIILLSAGLGPGASLTFDALYRNARNINPFWLKLSFPFLLIGFGTKMGLAPVHAWLPDAHAESPSAISAMLSGTLLNTAFLGVLRYYKVMVLAGHGSQARTLLMFMGFLSLFVSAVFILRCRNYKRLLAYSSIENMGILAIGSALGGVGLFAALLHMVSHSLAKASFFLTAGNIVHLFKTKEIQPIRGLIRSHPHTGWLWIFCFLAIMAMPPFPGFLSKFLMTKTLLSLEGGGWLLTLFLGLLLIILTGMSQSVMHMSFGPETPLPSTEPISRWNIAPQMVLLGLLVVLGLAMPQPISVLLHKAANSLAIPGW